VEEGGSVDPADELEEEKVFEYEECPHLIEELDILMNVKHHLHLVGNTHLKALSRWAVNFLEALLLCFTNEQKGVVKASAVSRAMASMGSIPQATRH
jgi:hypothetical protein